MKPEVKPQESFPWWKTTTVYHIYPRSFKDSNGDGIGDLRGIVSCLDYIRDLGFQTIWLSPVFASPQVDFGYDVSDYFSVAPEYGNNEDLKLLIEEVHSRDMKILLDLVLNHTSDRHPWFLVSCESRDNPKRDWYVWRDGRKPGGKAPPNNWRNEIGGAGWHYHEKTGQWYWAAFLPCQPDLNYRNPEVRETMIGVVKHWLRFGADGYRLDIIGNIFEDPLFRNNPMCLTFLPGSDKPGMLFRSHVMTKNHPDTISFMKELRKATEEEEPPQRLLVGEVSGETGLIREFCGKEKPDGLHSVFTFKVMDTPFKAKGFRKLIEELETCFPDPFIPAWAFSNHDRTRRISVLGGSIEKAKLNAALLLTARAIPFVYYGEEIGMEQSQIPMKEAKDGLTPYFYRRVPRFLLPILQKISMGAVNRDGCRTPMQWNDESNAGFTSPDAEPWLPVNVNYKSVNVKSQKNDPHSLYNCYRRFLRVRREYTALSRGGLHLLSLPGLPKGVLAFKREITPVVEAGAPEKPNRVYVFLNFMKKRTRIPSPEPGLKAVVSTYLDVPKVEGDSFNLRPHEGVVLA